MHRLNQDGTNNPLPHSRESGKKKKKKQLTCKYVNGMSNNHVRNWL